MRHSQEKPYSGLYVGG